MGPQSKEIPDLTEGQPDHSFVQRHCGPGTGSVSCSFLLVCSPLYTQYCFLSTQASVYVVAAALSPASEKLIAQD